jgi:Curli production assembly/transport component CsgF.
MVMKKMILLLIMVFSLDVWAQDFVYQPINPAFGGNPNNYSWLLSSADAQKENDSQNGTSTSSLLAELNSQQDPMKTFTTNLNNRILNELTNRIVQEQFGEFSLEQGTYKVGNYQIVINEGAKGVDIQVLDVNTGAESTITIPYY